MITWRALFLAYMVIGVLVFPLQAQTFSIRCNIPPSPESNFVGYQTPFPTPDGHYMYGVDAYPDPLYLVKTDGTGYFIEAIAPLNGLLSFYNGSRTVGSRDYLQFADDYLFCSLFQEPSVFPQQYDATVAALNTTTGVSFSWLLSQSINTRSTFDLSLDKQAIIMTIGTEMVALVDRATPATARWANRYISPDVPTTAQFIDGYNIHDIEPMPNGGYSLVGRLPPVQLDSAYNTPDYILQIGNEGEVVRAVALNVDIKNQRFDADGNLYLAASFTLLISSMQTPVIVKLSPELELLEAVVFDLPAVKGAYVENVQPTATGVSYNIPVFGDTQPGIFGRLDHNLHPITEIGYLVNSGTSIKTTGEFVFTYNTVFDPPFYTFPTGNHIYKTNINGIVDDCPNLPVCMTTRDTFVTIEPLTMIATPTEGPTIREQPYQFEPFTFEVEPFCQEAFYPEATFEMPDTLCRGPYRAPPAPLAAGATTTRWTIQGPDVDTIQELWQLFPFDFTTPGTYTITHQTWLLGCEDIYEQQVVILDSLQLNLAPEYYLCPDEPLRLDLNVSSNHPLREVRVDSVLVSGEVVISQPGVYVIDASDGYCMVQDTLRVRDLADAFPPPWLTLDTTDYLLCPENFPLTLSPTSAYTDQFALDGGLAQGTPLIIPQAGVFDLAAVIGNCRPSLPITVTERDCTPSVYLPNAFSPNRDGVNEVWQPLGTAFQALSLQIYDRWGQLVYVDQSGSPSWDGRRDGRMAAAGVYVVVFEFVNLKDNTTVQLTQDVALVR